MIDEKMIPVLKEYSRKIRIDIIDQVFFAQSGHIGGSLSCADILTVLYFHTMNVDPEAPGKADRDRFVLSKGHCSPALYAVLAQRGFFSREELRRFRCPESSLQGHPCRNVNIGVDMSTGSLGQGISAAVGMALSGKISSKPYRVYCLLGDGELQEGQVWEALMSAAHYRLDNLCVIIDYNGLQIDGPVSTVMSLGNLGDKLAAFGLHVEKIDGHDIAGIALSLENARAVKGRPSAIIAETVKGKGVSFMENSLSWHGTAPSKEERNRAVGELANMNTI
jgi:transketolase